MHINNFMLTELTCTMYNGVDTQFQVMSLCVWYFCGKAHLHGMHIFCLDSVFLHAENNAANNTAQQSPKNSDNFLSLFFFLKLSWS